MNQYALYVQNNPDLLAEFNRLKAQGNPNAQSIEQYGQYHWTNYGQREGRQSPESFYNQANSVATPSVPTTAQPSLPVDTTQPGTGTGTPTTTNPPPTTGFSDLLDTNVPTTGMENTPFTQAPTPNVTGGNYNQTQNSVQGGQFVTTGQNVQQQQGTSGSTTAQNTVGQTSQTGTQETQNTGQSSQTDNINQTTSGTQTSNTSGNNVTEAIDTLGFGQLLKDQIGNATATDAHRTGWLSDVMDTGGSGFQSQIDQAVRRSQSGPSLTGAGGSSQARMAAYATDEVARNNMNQRLAASQQLAGPTAVTTLSQAANPFIGQNQTTSGTNTTNNTSNTTGTNTSTGTTSNQGSMNSTSLTDQLQSMVGSQTGWQNLFSQGAESQAGATTAQSSQSGAGNIPQGAPVKSGGCVLCTAAIELGYEKNLRVLRRVIAYKLGPGWKSFRLAARGYFALFGPIANFLLDHPRLAALFYPLAKKVVYEELRVSGRSLPFRLDAWVVHWTGDALCRLIGLFKVPGHVTQPRILTIAGRNNILFEVKS